MIPVEKPSMEEEFLQLSSRQRLEIIIRLYKGKSKMSAVARELEATLSEVSRNFDRLEKAWIIEKDSNGTYGLTTYGKTICNQIPSFQFVLINKKYFRGHDFMNLPTKFIQRIGALASGEHHKGFTKVFEYWKQICKNSENYIYGILSEEPPELIEPIVAKAKAGVKINSVFSESAVIPKNRENLIQKLGVRKLVSEGLIERRMKNDISVAVILNEKEACVMFPSTDSETDISETFYSNDPLFQEWCVDYFMHVWNSSQPFQESKLSKS